MSSLTGRAPLATRGATAWKPSNRQEEAPTMFHSLLCTSFADRD